MIFKGILQEHLFVGQITPERMYMFDEDLHTGLSVVWNTGGSATFSIDSINFKLPKNHVLFISGLSRIEQFQFESLNVIQFNRPFYCVEEHDSQVGCKGLLFFGASSLPQIEIPMEKLKAFHLIYEMLLMEIEDESDELKIDMLRVLLKRFLIFSVRIFKKQKEFTKIDSTRVGLIREFNYLVEKHFKEYTTVKDYARILFKSPKTLSNLFKKHIDQTPLGIINERRLLEAKRMLKKLEFNIQEISEELSFSDVQSFSHFFKKHTSFTPSQFRSQL